MSIQDSVQSSRFSATEKMFGFHVKLLLVAVIARFTVDAVQFDCVFHSNVLAFGARPYTCEATVTLSGLTTLENVTGAHEANHTNDGVECLSIKEQNLQSIPQGIVNVFKNLKALHFWHTQLVSISAKDLQPFPQLEYFELTGSSVTSLDGDLFSFNPLLKYVYFNLNQIQHIGPDLVTNLNNLKFLAFNANICIDESATTRAAVVELALRLSVLCPPLNVTTTVATTTTLNLTSGEK